jgi:acetylornithine deacetylase/succinyl-diaminopimelate desuccinylase-like protein
MSVDRFVVDNRDRLLSELLDYLRIPSVSTDPRRSADVRAAAEFSAAALARTGLEASVLDTAGHPVVVATGPAVPGAPKVLVYGHYDVQPAEPLEAWHADPFEPVVGDGFITARGASDDKGQVYAHVKGVEALLAVDGTLPVNLAFLIEGEEEIGSPSLPAFLEAHADALAADVVVISDGAMVAPGVPTITYGLRGLAYATLRVRGAGRDLHSGAYGGGVPNALDALARLLAGLKDERGRILVPGFYDDVRDLTPEERAALARVPFDEQAFRADAGVSATPGEAGYSLLERIWARPTLDVNGLSGGFQGAGAKTVIAAEAMAKVSCRLVPDQEPQAVFDGLRAHLLAHAPEGVAVEVLPEGLGRPAMTPLDAPSTHAARAALLEVWGTEPVFARSGGSIPIVADFQRVLGAEPLLIGFGREDDRAHAPNERFAVDDYLQGVRVSAALLRHLASMGTGDGTDGAGAAARR